MRTHLPLAVLSLLLACADVPDPDGPGDTDTDTDTDAAHVFHRVDDAPDGATVGGSAIAIDDDGTLYVSWVDDRNGSADVWLTWSLDDGQTWAPSVQADGAEEVYSAGWSYPRLTLGTDDIAWIGTQGGPKVVARQAPKATLAFGPPINPAGVTEIAHGQLTDDDELWLAWLDYPGAGVTQVLLGNPQTGYGEGAVQVNAGLGNGVSCACCPMDLQFRGDQTPMLAWRDNLDNVRNMGFAAGTPGYGVPGDAVYATSTDWTVYSCPTQGPRLLEMSDGSLRIIWSDSSSGQPTTYIAASADDGATWTSETPISAGYLGVSPIAAVSPEDGTVYVAVKTSIGATGRYVLTASADGGATFAPSLDLVPSAAAGQLTFVELATGDGRLGLVGVGSSDNRVHFTYLD